MATSDVLRSDALQLVTCTVDLRYSPTDVDAAVELLLSAVGRTEALPGCLSCRVSRDAADENRVRYEQSWDSEPAFRRHVQSDGFRFVLAAMDMSFEEPEVMVGDLAGRCGLGYLHELRGAGA
jgi:quinol monooxygenase YgiN